MSSSFLPRVCPCKLEDGGVRINRYFRSNHRRRKRSCLGLLAGSDVSSRKWRIGAHMLPSERENPSPDPEFLSSTARSVKKAQEFLVSKRLSNEVGYKESESESAEEPMQMASTFTNYQEDPLVNKLRTQLGVIHPIPSPPINRSIVGFFVFFFFVGVVFDKLWTSRKRNKSSRDAQQGTWPQVPTSFSQFLEKDLQRKESVEWVNMVVVKLWKVYRGGIENWIIGLLQPVIDNLKKPDYVQRVEIKQFSLGDEPLSVRNVERKTSRRVNDLQ